jgi:fimbrial chaperone protein
MALILRRISSVEGVAMAVALLTLIGVRTSESQQQGAPGLTVTPVSIMMAPGRATEVLRIQNNTGREIGFQVRPFAWTQPGGVDQLTRTDLLAISPPVGRIATGSTQVVRLVLRQPAQNQEATYRILFDQVPPPPQPGAVNFAYRFSIPVFAEPSKASPASRVNWSLQSDGGAYYLVAANSGASHDVFRDLALTGAGGAPIAIQQGGSPYVLPGATRRWRVVSNGFSPSGQTLRVTAQDVAGKVDQPLAGP